MTKRQANMLTWLVLFPLTLFVWAQFLPRCTFGCAKAVKIQDRLPPPYEPTVKRYTICSIAGAVLGSSGSVSRACRAALRCRAGARPTLLATDIALVSPNWGIGRVQIFHRSPSCECR
jgi:hypothetical protein